MTDAPAAAAERRPDLVGRLRAAGCVFAEDEALLLVAAARTAGELDALVARRISGVPLEQVLGWAEFGGLRIATAPGVFVPRRRTEHVVALAAAVARPGAVVLDLCCGTGAIGAAVAARAAGIELHAADIDPVAVVCARQNVEPFGGAVYLGDLFEPVPVALRGRVDILVVNAPYVPTASIALMPPEARLHEPRAALDGGPDGLDVQRRVLATAGEWLAPGGHVLVETSAQQARRTVEAAARGGLDARIETSGHLGATVVVARSR
ncbi:putative protein N(5)-glutamine methyltransferase [Georgenia subflava]|uniref:peptide chain release factor N(5)-glutamine methyltransferase n=1 Tax=Georgenia subflava TaxID=1622177 RepID=A0A6N7EJ63_9MICO|nr:putative protein N(5)-glutamine methyltransferase [Georgenia subflava]MPV36777.1 putative protein N(5)-glutamine methyltransferase [Georgenia subflava]